MRVGLIGLGAIGRGVLDLLAGDDAVEVVGALVADPSKPRPPGAPKICASVAELTEQKPRVVVEAGGHAALRSCGPPILRAGIDLIMVSVGALAQRDTEQAIRDAACAGGSQQRVGGFASQTFVTPVYSADGVVAAPPARGCYVAATDPRGDGVALAL